MDAIFERYTKKYFPDKDWLLFKAQGITESNLDPSAKSVVGAMGIMQIMPKTWAMIRKQLNILNDPWNPEYNIRAGIYYDRKKYDYWSFERPEYDRLCLMFASYNAGTRNIQRAQDLASQKILNKPFHTSKKYLKFTIHFNFIYSSFLLWYNKIEPRKERRLKNEKVRNYRRR